MRGRQTRGWICQMGIALLALAVLAACGGAPSSEAQEQEPRTAHSTAQASVNGEHEWQLTGSLALGRLFHTATQLADGRVLVVGGYNQTSELYNPVSRTWSPAGNTLTTHRYHSATLLMDGRVLVAGGEQNWFNGISAEVHSPVTGMWSAAGSMVTHRSHHAAILLPSGRVLAMGGIDSAGRMLASAELYDPVTEAWSLTGSMGMARRDHSATLLSSGKVLVVGGSSGSGSLASAEIYDPVSNTWTATHNMSRPRGSHTATLLSSGKVLVAGSDGSDWTGAASAELFDPANGTWAVTGAMSKPRRHHSATRLPSGKVLVAGGFHEYTGISYTAELFDPASSTWSATASMNVDRYGHAATLLNGGKVLVVGGFSNHDQASAELFLSGTPIPPEPVAPPLDETQFTSLSEATEFLYSGPQPLQVGVAPGTIEARRAAVLRGQVKTREGTPLPGVTITILDHPEYGQTLTRESGMFDLVVNGGGLLTVEYKKEEYLLSHRQVQAPWADYAWLPDVVLIPRDSQVTTIILDGTAGDQVAQGSVVSDSDGTRQARVLFPAGTQASVVLPDGSTAPLTTLHVRATEYTVGETGPQAMPAALPPSTAYTYAVELSVDEAGDREVRFNQPVFLYVDNFLGFPVGSIVPLGWYDTPAGVWKALDNGRILRVLSVEHGMAVLDVTGDGVADEGDALATLGITPGERQRLAMLFTPGSSFSRIPVPHFTTFDPNHGEFVSADARQPAEKVSLASRPDENPECQSGSIIECQNQTLGESAEVVGTSFQLHYRSDRVPGRRTSHSLEIPLSGATLPGEIQRIHLEIVVAGRRFFQTVAAVPNQTYSFEWDGRDAYGRLLQGEWPVKVRIGYAYPLVYQSPPQLQRSFGRLSGVPMSLNGTMRDLTLWQEYVTSLGDWTVPPQQMGGWTPDVHHAYNLTNQTLYLGNGVRRSTGLKDSTPVVLTVAGNGEPGDSGDGAPATQARLWNPRDVDVAPDGSLYIADSFNNRVRRIHPDGQISTVPGSEEYQPHYVEVGPDGSVYVSHSYLHCIRRIAPDGTATTFVGQCGVQGGDSGDEGPATEAQLSYPQDIAMGRDGNLYIADFDNDRIRFVTPDGSIHTLAGKPQGRGYCGDGGPASNACLNGPWGLAIGPDGSVYVSDSYNHRIRRIGMNGLITTVAGTGEDGSTGTTLGDGGQARQARLSTPKGIAMDAKGNLYIADHVTRIRRVSPEGIITRFAGKVEQYGYSGEGEPASTALFDSPVGLAVSPDGLLYVCDEWNHRLRRVGFLAPGMGEGEAWVPSEDGSELYVFSWQGRHLRTVDAVTQVVLYQFAYDSGGRLVSIRDRNGLITHFERDASGKPLAIVAPHGQRTRLEVDANGYLSAIINPADERLELVHTFEGLLIARRDGRGGLHSYEYDSKGRLKKDSNPVGGFKELIRETLEGEYTVTLSTALGRTTRYRVQNLLSGEQRRTTTSPAGEVSITVRKPNGTIISTAPDGTVTTQESGPDPRFGMQAPVSSLSIRLPSGLTSTRSRAREVTFVRPGDILNIASLTETVTVNGLASTATYDAGTRTLTTRSPLGKTATTTLDTQGRVTKREIPGLLPLQYSYGSGGRLQSVKQGARTAHFTYSPSGYLETQTDVLSLSTHLTYDLAGRVRSHELPGQRLVEYGYDGNSNLTSLTPPGRPAHAFMYTAADREEGYIPPALPDVPLTAFTAQYNLDEQPTGVQYPDGATLSIAYEDDASFRKGRLLNYSLSPPPGGRYAPRSRQASYHVGSGYLRALTDSRGPSIAYQYDGALTTKVSWTGAVQGSVGYSYDNFFRVSSVSINDTPVASLTYDADGLVKQVGSLTLDRDPDNGALTGTVQGGMATALSHNSYGEMEHMTASYGATSLFSLSLVRDSAGRIQEKRETVQGVAHVYVYTYDVSGRLQEVREDGALISVAEYDGNAPGNGNRTALTQGGLTRTAVYDTQDRLLRYGDTTYSYGPNGDLQVKQVGNQVTTYVYDALGNLLSATLPAGTQIEYIIDAQNRRVGKKVNGVQVQGVLYDGQLRVIAELDGSNRVVSWFVYASQEHVPDYMVKDGTPYRIITDHLGSPRLVVNASNGMVAQRMDYDAWGNVLADSNPGFQPFGFAGGLHDQDTKLVRYGARDYDAETGRWTSKDPLRFAGGDTNIYNYVRHNPVQLIDPTGLEPYDTGYWRPRAMELLFGFSPRTPDYISVTAGMSTVKFIGGVPVVIGINFNVTKDRYNNWYVGGGPAVGDTPGWGLTCNAGWLLSNQTPSEADLKGFFPGKSWSVSAGIIGGIAFTQAIGNAYPGALELGMTTPQMSVGGANSSHVGKWPP